MSTLPIPDVFDALQIHEKEKVQVVIYDIKRTNTLTVVR